MTIQEKGILITNISTDLADNNAGLISAEDVRENMKDTVESIESIVSKGNFNSLTPFENSVRAKIVAGSQGVFIAESGVQFASVDPNGTAIQLVPYPGNDALDHNVMQNLTVGDVHTQYLNTNGQRPMEGNFGLDTYWINSEGNSDGLNVTSANKGVKFESIDSNNETMHVGSKTTVEFDVDASRMTNSKGVAKAWVNFDASALSDLNPGDIVVNASYNIDNIQQGSGDGKFVIYFKEEIPVPYVAIGNSNSTTDNDSAEDFDLNSVGIIERTSTYISFVVRNDNGEYVNAKVNDLVIFGLSHADETPDTTAAPTP